MHRGLVLRVPGDIWSMPSQLTIHQSIEISAEVALIKERDIDVLGPELASGSAEALPPNDIPDHPSADPTLRCADLPDGVEQIDQPSRSLHYRPQFGRSRRLGRSGTHSDKYEIAQTQTRAGN
jgi:hypothetical protein